MADQEMEQQDFTEDYSGGDFQENGAGVTENQEQGGEGHAATVQDSGAADAPGRDDDRYGGGTSSIRVGSFSSL